MRAMRRVRLAVIGAMGNIGQEHISAISKNTDVAELVAISDVQQDRLKGAAKKLGVVGVSNWEDLLWRDDIDAVTVATPHLLHPEQVIAALEAGKHVLCEKPLAICVSDVDRILRVADRVQAKLGVCFVLRGAPEIVAIRRLNSTGQLGRLVELSLSWAGYRSGWYFKSSNWRGTWKGEGGGILLNQASHYLDIFCSIPGMMPSRVWGLTRTQMHHIEVDDTAMALLEYPCGVVGSIRCSLNRLPNGVRLEVYGERGAVVLDDGKLRHFRFGVDLVRFTDEYLGPRLYAQPEVQHVPVSVKQGSPATHEGVVRNFCFSIREGMPLWCSAREARKSVELANAITLSAYTGNSVDLPLEPSRYDEFLSNLWGKNGKPKVDSGMQSGRINS